MILSFQPSNQSERKMVEARIQVNYPLATTIILEGGEVLDLSAWRIRRFKVIRADKREIQSLTRMGVL